MAIHARKIILIIVTRGIEGKARDAISTTQFSFRKDMGRCDAV